ncbi:MAG: lactate dehydrogenase [Gordonia sp. (in: high G+C Gram-positive bacteria)]|nr:MAG: lactate dehydrogenase [Gordonia sp. (in: high G+C Gram-positive bacteria)]
MRFVPLLEDPGAVLDARTIARGPRVMALSTGGEDIATEMGAEPTPEVLRLPKLLVHMAAKAERLLSFGLLRSVADYAVMLMLMCVRDAKSVIRRTAVSDYRLSEVRGRELRDMTVGVIGTGRIGTAVMDRLRGFGSRILAYDIRPTVCVDYVDLDELVQHSDIITLHTPLDAGTHHLLDHERLSRMKRGAYIVNTGRGSLIDTEALVGALERGDLGGAALDVVEGEEGIFYADCRTRPLGRTMLSRLQRMPNVIVSPHTAYYTDHALRDTVENSIVNCLRFEREHRG